MTRLVVRYGHFLGGGLVFGGLEMGMRGFIFSAVLLSLVGGLACGIRWGNKFFNPTGFDLEEDV